MKDEQSFVNLNVSGMGDFNAYVGRHIDGFDGIRGGFGVGQRNLEGKCY